MLQTPTKSLFNELDTDEVHLSAHNNPPSYHTPHQAFHQPTELQTIPTDFSVSENETMRPADHRDTLSNQNLPLSESIVYNSVRDDDYQYFTNPPTYFLEIIWLHLGEIRII